MLKWPKCAFGFKKHIRVFEFTIFSSGLDSLDLAQIRAVAPPHLCRHFGSIVSTGCHAKECNKIAQVSGGYHWSIVGVEQYKSVVRQAEEV